MDTFHCHDHHIRFKATIDTCIPLTATIYIVHTHTFHGHYGHICTVPFTATITTYFPLPLWTHIPTFPSTMLTSLPLSQLPPVVHRTIKCFLFHTRVWAVCRVAAWRARGGRAAWWRVQALPGRRHAGGGRRHAARHLRGPAPGMCRLFRFYAKKYHSPFYFLSYYLFLCLYIFHLVFLFSFNFF